MLEALKGLREERERQQSLISQFEIRNYEVRKETNSEFMALTLKHPSNLNHKVEKRNMELCWQQVEWKTQLDSLQTALSKRDQQLLENTVGQADKEAKMMQAVADAKRCEPIINDLKAKLVETEATHEKAHT